MTVNENIRLLRTLNNLTQEEMAMKLSMSKNGYAKIERGETKVKVERLKQIADLFNITVVELMLLGDKNVYFVNDNNGSLSNNQHSGVLNNNNDSLNGDEDNEQVVSENVHYYNGSEELTHEIEKLQLSLQHKEDIIKQKDELLAMKDKEIQNLTDIITLLKNK